jgi:hypothetical protein
MTRAGTSHPSYTCPWCLYRTYHEQDIANWYCFCCGSSLDPTLAKDCPHRAGETIRDLVDRGVTLVRRDPWAPFNYLEIETIAGFINPMGIIHSPMEWERPDGRRWAGDLYEKPARTPLWQLPRAGWEAYTGPTTWPDGLEPPIVTDHGDGSLTVDTRQKDPDDDGPG